MDDAPAYQYRPLVSDFDRIYDLGEEESQNRFSRELLDPDARTNLILWQDQAGIDRLALWVAISARAPG